MENKKKFVPNKNHKLMDNMIHSDDKGLHPLQAILIEKASSLSREYRIIKNNTTRWLSTLVYKKDNLLNDKYLS